jgi:single-strand DNA-binding protein
MFNKAIIVGRLRRSPKLKQVGETSIGNLTVATDHSAKRDSKWEKITTWHNVVCFGAIAENCEKFLDKGSLVCVEGRIENRSYEGKDGTKKYTSEIIAETVKFLSLAEKREETTEAVENPVSFEQDEIPF